MVCYIFFLLSSDSTEGITEIFFDFDQITFDIYYDLFLFYNNFKINSNNKCKFKKVLYFKNKIDEF